MITSYLPLLTAPLLQARKPFQCRLDLMHSPVLSALRIKHPPPLHHRRVSKDVHDSQVSSPHQEHPCPLLLLPHHCIPDSGGCTCGTATPTMLRTACLLWLFAESHGSGTKPYKKGTLPPRTWDCFQLWPSGRERECGYHALVLTSALTLLLSRSPGACCCLYSIFLFH